MASPDPSQNKMSYVVTFQNKMSYVTQQRSNQTPFIQIESNVYSCVHSLLHVYAKKLESLWDKNLQSC